MLDGRKETRLGLLERARAARVKGSPDWKAEGKLKKELVVGMRGPRWKVTSVDGGELNPRAFLPLTNEEKESLTMQKRAEGLVKHANSLREEGRISVTTESQFVVKEDPSGEYAGHVTHLKVKKVGSAEVEAKPVLTPLPLVHQENPYSPKLWKDITVDAKLSTAPGVKTVEDFMRFVKKKNGKNGSSS